MSELFDMMAHALKPLDADQKKRFSERDRDLHWFEDDDLPFGWCLHAGYSLEWDDGNAVVYIHELELNTGQRCIKLKPIEIDPKQLQTLEGRIAENEEAGAEAAARHLAHDPDDRGDWEYHARLDRNAP